MSTIRLNITLPEDLANQIDNLVEPKKKSRFIAEAIRQRIEALERKKRESLLKEGYKAMYAESLEIAKDFEAVDLEGWDEY